MTATNHEFVVFRTDLPDDALPVDKGQEMEHTLKTIGEAEDIAPGHDALICNKPARSMKRGCRRHLS
ncbi:hypothetical protein [Burkholderia cepacia]|uniref:hypothetical protein n=1 Tax=Burkholderia cepacia TaxID=292 RepID=UPI00384E154C